MTIMECLSEAFNSSVHVTLDETDVNLIHPRYSQYKYKPSKNSQQERRKIWLISQKEKREEIANAHRDLPDNNSTTRGNFIGKPKKRFRDSLMLSEWLLEVPDDIKSSWLVKICPEGKRVFVIAEKGKTMAFGRNGRLVTSFKSLLPGGSKGTTAHTHLDCIWHPKSKVFYVLDVMFWGCPLLNCEAQFRFYWLNSKLEENPELMTSGKDNWHSFREVQLCSNLEESLSIHPCYQNNDPKVDGILFYHKEGFYSSGKRSPLVTWLKPFMLPNIIGIPVHAMYAAEIPPQYSKMDVSEVSSENHNGQEMAS